MPMTVPIMPTASAERFEDAAARRSRGRSQRQPLATPISAEHLLRTPLPRPSAWSVEAVELGAGNRGGTCRAQLLPAVSIIVCHVNVYVVWLRE
jgi:hypothetical protein